MRQSARCAVYPTPPGAGRVRRPRGQLELPGRDGADRRTATAAGASDRAGPARRGEPAHARPEAHARARAAAVRAARPPCPAAAAAGRYPAVRAVRGPVRRRAAGEHRGPGAPPVAPYPGPPPRGRRASARNDGAAPARGQYLVFLNNDTVPQPGWLDALLDTFSTHPDTGLAGAQLLYPDGRLQEAGGLVFRDGSAWNYGRFESPDDPRFSYVRATDYVSGAAAAIPRALFERIGGFDRRYAPAYYEDTDLAFAVREAGHAVRYQPAARVLHDEGTTAGSDPASGVKAWQARNRAVFAAHRAQALAALPGPGPTPSPATLHRRQRQVLVIDGATPRPDHDSASLRLVNLMRLLQAEGAHVVFLPA